MNAAEIITAILAVIGLFFTGIELRMLRKSRKNEYDQLRRDKTVDLVIFYSEKITKETKTIEKIVSSLSDEQCQDLYNCTPIIVEERTKKKICEICPRHELCLKNISEVGSELCKKDEEYVIDGETLYLIRNNVVSYLNTLESVLLAWQLGIVDQQVIEEQFKFLDKKRQRERALETFRTIAGSGQSYPAIEKFYQHLDKKRLDEAAKTLKDILN